MHNIYTTDGFILKSANFGEANKFFFIFTKEFGLIKAAAQGARLLKSKLRYSLEDYSFTQVSVVRGREIWRLTSAQNKISVKNFLKEDKEKFLLLSRIFSLLLRLLQGEEKNDLLFESLKASVDFLSENTLSKEQLSNFECILALRILSSLGYIGNLGEFDQFTESPYFSTELLNSMSLLKTKAILEINKSLKETHL
jgi:DNA repair protein RecO (recombination protein O)